MLSIFGLKFNPFRSWTVAGVATVLGTGLVGHFAPEALSPGLSFVLKAAGGLAATIGGRNALEKAALAIVQALAAKSTSR